MNELPLLSICVTCRDNREDFYEDRGGNGASFGNKFVRYYDEQLW